jgi:hypothetical protein
MVNERRAGVMAQPFSSRPKGILPAETTKPLAQQSMGPFEIRLPFRILAKTESLVEQRNDVQLGATVVLM